MKKDKFATAEATALRLNDELRLDTLRFFRNANDIYRKFDDWKDNDRFYFIPLKLNMTYSVAGIQARMAEPPIHLGTFIRNTLDHKDLFTAPCPVCGHRLLPYSYNGSPLSGRVDLQATCPECGWDKYIMVSGWHIRSQALKASQHADSVRMLRAKLLRPRGFKPATVEDLLKWLME